MAFIIGLLNFRISLKEREFQIKESIYTVSAQARSGLCALKN